MFGIDNLVPVTLFNKGQAARIFDRVKTERQLVVLKNNAPSAVIISPDEYMRLTEIEENYYLLELANSRLAGGNMETAVAEADALRELGVSEDEINAAEDIELS